MAVDFQVVCLDEGKCAATDFTEMGEGGDMSSPEFVGGSPIQGGRRS
jgi:hypothetical protein